MNGFFARLYEWFGLLPLYSHDLSEFLNGMDFGCTGYWALHWYLYVGLFMVVNTFLLFGLQYDLISGKRFKKQGHWALAALVVVGFNFIFAFTIPFVAIETGNYCLRLKISAADCLGFGLSNALWSFILFSLLSLIQMGLRANSGGNPS